MDVGNVQVVEHGLPLFLVSFFANIHKGVHQVQVSLFQREGRVAFGTAEDGLVAF